MAACRSLHELHALTACVPNVTFGCDGLLERLWVSHGCRGIFVCNGIDIGLCGPPRFELRGAHRHHCSCAADRHTRIATDAALRRNEAEPAAAAAAAAIGGAEPLPSAISLEAAWTEPHLMSMQALSARAQSLIGGPAGRESLMSTPPATVPLSTCGALMVPFGGALLADYERHLRSFVVHDTESQASSHAADVSGGGGNASTVIGRGGAWRTHGYVHAVSEYIPPAGMSALEEASHRLPRPLVLRTRLTPLRWDATQRCFAYRVAVWNGYMEWVLGELDVFPRLHLCWLDWEHMHTTTVAERYRSLADELRRSARRSPRNGKGALSEDAPAGAPLTRAPPTREPPTGALPTGAAPTGAAPTGAAPGAFGGGDEEEDGRPAWPSLTEAAEIDIADCILGLLKALAKGSALVNLDWKPSDLLVRPAASAATSFVSSSAAGSGSCGSGGSGGSGGKGGGWEARLSDVYSQGGRLQSVAGIVPGLDPGCYLWLNLELPTTVLACGPHRHTHAARHFVSRALHAMASSARLMRVCQPTRYMDINASNAFEETIGDDAGLATGQLRVSRAFELHARMNLLSRGHPVKGAHEISELFASLHVQWAANRTATCPRPWDVEYKL